MADPTFIACPHCGEPVVMTAMQHELFRGRALACLKCAKQFTVDPQRTPLFTLSPTGRAYLSSPPTAAEQPATATEPPPPEAARPEKSGATTTVRQRDGDREAAAAAWKAPALVVGALLLLATVLAVILLPPMTTARASQRQLNCASNLRQIGIALQVYAGNHGEYPDTLASLISTNLIRPDTLVCPATGHTPAPGSTNQQQAMSLSTGRHLSYVYIGANLTPAAAAGSQTIILYEPITNHGSSKGTHVLYANGTIAFLTPPVAQQTINALAAPRAAATAPAAPTSPSPG